MQEGAWVASDTVDYQFKDRRPDWISLVSVAIATDDIKKFNEEYEEIVKEKREEYEIPTKIDVLKNQDIRKWVPEWQQESARKDIIESLLQIPHISNIQLTETTLDTQWITLYDDNYENEDRIESDVFVNNILKQYYNLSSIWVYLRENDEMPWGHRNVATDQFNGKITEMWNDICERADEINIIPHGDMTYPLLSLADLTMNLAAQEIDEWKIGNIHSVLEGHTPKESAYVESTQLDGGEDLEMMIPYTKSDIRTKIHYPHPVVYIHTDGFDNDQIYRSDIYNEAKIFARKNGGAVKFLNEKEDEKYFTKDDILLCLNGKKARFENHEKLNQNPIEILSIEEAFDYFSDSGD